MGFYQQIITSFPRFWKFTGKVCYRIFTPPWETQEFARHSWHIITRCVLPVTAVVFPFGMVLALQGMQIFELFGAERLLSSLVSVAVFRELSPVLASLLVAAQGGSSFAAELGAMRITEELDATEVMAIDSIRVHVVPRVCATMLATPVLNLAGCVAGISGAYVTAVWIKGEPGGIFLANMWEMTTMTDIMGGMFKTLVFGIIIGMIACFQGFYTSGGAAGVGRSVNNTVVLSVTCFIVCNYLLTSLLFGVVGT